MKWLIIIGVALLIGIIFMAVSPIIGFILVTVVSIFAIKAPVEKMMNGGNPFKNGEEQQDRRQPALV